MAAGRRLVRSVRGTRKTAVLVALGLIAACVGSVGHRASTAAAAQTVDVPGAPVASLVDGTANTSTNNGILSPGDEQVILQWMTPLNTGGAPINVYEISIYKLDENGVPSQLTWLKNLTVRGGTAASNEATTLLAPGLYQAAISAVNDNGDDSPVAWTNVFQVAPVSPSTCKVTPDVRGSDDAVTAQLSAYQSVARVYPGIDPATGETTSQTAVGQEAEFAENAINMRMDRALDFGTLIPRLQATFGPRYGGAFIDNLGQISVLCVVLTNVGPADLQTAQSVAAAVAPSGPSKLVGVAPGVYSLAQLGQFRDSMIQQLNAVPTAQYLFQNISIGVDEEANAVRVTTDVGDAATIAAVTAGVPATAVAVSVNNSTYAALQSRTSFPPYQGGLKISIGSSACTAAFLMKDPNNVRYGSTANHCTDAGDHIFVGSRDVGYTSLIKSGNENDADHPNGDFALFNLNTQPSDNSAQMYRGNDRSRPVSSEYSDAEMVKHVRVCHEGYNGGHCDEIYETDHYVRFKEHGRWESWSHEWCTHASASPGDSGAPVFQVREPGVRAAGLLNVGATAVLGYGGSSCYTTINMVETASGGAQLVTTTYSGGVYGGFNGQNL